MRRTLVPAVILLLGAAGCGSSTAAASPSRQARLVCGDEAARDIATALGVRTSQAPAPTWDNGVYRCRYVYPAGAITVSVKDLASPDAATTYLSSTMAATAGAVDLPGVGQAAFAMPDGSTVVRKDAQVMTVDVSGLPVTFGVPPHVRSIAAITVANTILDCWTES